MTIPLLVDSHCHLDFPDFAEELPDVVARAHDAGIGILQTISTKMTTFPNVLGVAEQFDNVYASVGIHPHEVEKEEKITTAELVEKAQHPKVIGIGETGLDYFYEHSPRELQQASFLEHIGAARETKLPLIIHTREADEDTMQILRDEQAKGAFPGLIHCFTSGRGVAEGAIELGMYVSISGIVTFKSAKDLQEIVKDLPLERLLVETDAPYLAPVPQRGKTNEPAFTRHTAEFLAELKGISFEEVAEVTTRNFLELFNKVKVA
jgi:TatD DNase family protein